MLAWLGAGCVHAAEGASGECPAPDDAQAESWAGQRQWQRLEQAGYRLGELSVRVDDVYVGSPLPWYQRLANTLHTDTHPEVIRDLLIVTPGDEVRAERIYEAERVLRGQSFVKGARIVPTGCEGERVAAEVRIRDAWTLQVGAGFGQAGGASSSSVGFTDENILGSGKTVSLDWSADPERTTVDLGYADQSLLGSLWTLELNHRDHSDGHGDAVALGYPFRRADQVWGIRTELEDARNELDFDYSGDTAYSAEVASEQARLELLRLVDADRRGGWRAGLGWHRDYAAYGELEEEDPELRPPPVLADRRLQGPYLVAERFSRRYKSFRNLRAIGATEDYDLGLDTRLSLGRYTEGEGKPWFYDLRIHYGLALGERDLLSTEIDFEGRYREDTGAEASERALRATHYHRTSERNTLVTHGEYIRLDRPDPEDELYLGGFEGLLAYPDRFRSGDRRWRVHLEDRYVSDLVLFDTVQMGYTAYLEAGRIRGRDGRWSRTLADVGAGLRLGSLRSSFGTVAYVTLAMPLVDAGDQDDYSFVVGSTVNF